MRIKSESRRQDIIDAARTVFQEMGFATASMSEISARVGGSKATLYSYFASKDELFVEVMRQFAEGEMQAIFGALDARADLPTTLLRFGERLLTMVSTPELVSAHRNAFAESGKSLVGQLFYERGPLEGLKVLSAFLQACMSLGKLREADSFIAAQHLVGLLRAEVMDRLLLGVQNELATQEIPPIVARAIDIFLRGYAPEAHAA